MPVATPVEPSQCCRSFLVVPPSRCAAVRSWSYRTAAAQVAPGRVVDTLFCFLIKQPAVLTKPPAGPRHPPSQGGGRSPIQIPVVPGPRACRIQTRVPGENRFAVTRIPAAAAATADSESAGPGIGNRASESGPCPSPSGFKLPDGGSSYPMAAARARASSPCWKLHPGGPRGHWHVTLVCIQVSDQT